MDSFSLACYCRAFYLNAQQFKALRGASRNEVVTFITMHKRRSLEEIERREVLLYSSMEQMDPRQVLYPGHTFYPREFENIDQPPVFLMAEGDLEILKIPKIAVVGSRRPEERFLLWLDTELKAFLEQTGAAVVSGGAIGIDQKASQVASRCLAPQVIVLPSGLQRPYPSTIKGMYSGPKVLFLSEYFPDEVMQKNHFVRRNRLISALGQFLLAVQFEVKSGTMITVNYALAQNKEIASLPDHPMAALSSGNLKVIREGAHVVGSCKDLLSLWIARQIAL